MVSFMVTQNDSFVWIINHAINKNTNTPFLNLFFLAALKKKPGWYDCDAQRGGNNPTQLPQKSFRFVWLKLCQKIKTFLFCPEVMRRRLSGENIYIFFLSQPAQRHDSDVQVKGWREKLGLGGGHTRETLMVGNQWRLKTEIKQTGSWCQRQRKPQHSTC